jgi:hypothetical protein
LATGSVSLPDDHDPNSDWDVLGTDDEMLLENFDDDDEQGEELFLLDKEGDAVYLQGYDKGLPGDPIQSSGRKFDQIDTQYLELEDDSMILDDDLTIEGDQGGVRQSSVFGSGNLEIIAISHEKDQLEFPLTSVSQSWRSANSLLFGVTCSHPVTGSRICGRSAYRSVEEDECLSRSLTSSTSTTELGSAWDKCTSGSHQKTGVCEEEGLLEDDDLKMGLENKEVNDNCGCR